MSNIANQPVPFIKTGQALQSFRYSGYTLEAAAAEVIDNSIEAKANNIYVYLIRPIDKVDKRPITSVAFFDDGKGMDAEELQLYPQIGHSSRYMRNDTIGKYGVGAKLGALSVAQRFDVWSRLKETDPWQHVYMDLAELLRQERNGEDVGITPPSASSLPASLAERFESKSGTAITWTEIDVVEAGRLGTFDELRKHLEKQLSRMFRNFIYGGINIYVNDKKLRAYDPLFLMEKTFNDEALNLYYTNEKKADRIKHHYEAKLIADEKLEIGGFEAQLRVTLFPPEVVRKRGMGGDELAKRLQLPENEGAISFIRLNREVSYTNVPKIFYRGVVEADRFIGIEVSFGPELDLYFGVRNIKRGVEPHGELRTEIRNRLKKHLKTARKELNDIWGQEEQKSKVNYGEHNSMANAVKQVDSTMPKGKAKAPTENEEKQILDDLAKDVVGSDEPDDQQKYLENIKTLPFVVESVDYPGDQFIDIRHLANQIIIRLNTRHKFYREMWSPVKKLSETDATLISVEDAKQASKRTIEALTLLLIAYAKAESMDDDPEEHYRPLTSYWGIFLNTLMTKVKDVL